MRDHTAEAFVALMLAKARALDALAFLALAVTALVLVIAGSIVFHY